MRWLVTFKKGIDHDRARSLLEELGSQVSAQARFISLGEDEEAVEVEGPARLPQLATKTEDILKVYPSSKMSPY
jgi:hypothetical protein